MPRNKRKIDSDDDSCHGGETTRDPATMAEAEQMQPDLGGGVPGTEPAQGAEATVPAPSAAPAPAPAASGPATEPVGLGAASSSSAGEGEIGGKGKGKGKGGRGGKGGAKGGRGSAGPSKGRGRGAGGRGRGRVQTAMPLAVRPRKVYVRHGKGEKEQLCLTMVGERSEGVQLRKAIFDTFPTVHVEWVKAEPGVQEFHAVSFRSGQDMPAEMMSKILDNIRTYTHNGQIACPVTAQFLQQSNLDFASQIAALTPPSEGGWNYPELTVQRSNTLSDPDGMALPLAVYTWGGATYTLHQWLREQDEARSFRVGNRDDFRAAWGWEEGWTDAAECAAYLRTTYGVRVTELPDDVQDAGPAAAQGQPVEQPVSYHAPDFSQFGDD